ncbi:MAG: sulfate adenylyltransferase [Planctomycetes bacterium]|nr:sulfate adenylyltransferase [Planctomycetota bacterium]
MSAQQNAPHGGTLVNRIATPARAAELKKLAATLPTITLTAKQACDLEMIAIGAFSPLTGFVGKADFESICKNTRLANGTVWPIPISLAIDDKTKAAVGDHRHAALKHSDGTLLGVIEIHEIFAHDKKLEIPNVFGTEDPKHPGVEAVLAEGDWLVGGPIEVLTVTPEKEPGEQFTEYRLPPAAVRAEFAKRGWSTVAAFQTRNPIHRAHEYLTKCALEMTDGLLIHPLVGETKPGDIPADVRMDCYKVLVDKYYNLKRTMLSVMPAAMRYAGPKEAILHALVRKNYGITHFIVGRDHAGVGNYYGTYDAQKIFDRFKPEEIGLTILKFENTFYCKKTKGMASDKTTNSAPEDRVFLAGTKVREMLKAGQRPPEEFSRPEVADILMNSSWVKG